MTPDNPTTGCLHRPDRQECDICRPTQNTTLPQEVSVTLLKLAKELQNLLLIHGATFPDLERRMLRNALDLIKEGWAIQRDREQQLEREIQRSVFGGTL